MGNSRFILLSMMIIYVACRNTAEIADSDSSVYCDPIGEFYGGEVFNDNDSMEVGTVANYKCDEAFSNSSCLDNRTWFPEPPKCYKKATAECPTNSDCHGSFSLLHNQSKTIRCDKNYDLFDFGKDEFFDQKEIQITNLNGTFNPAVPICVENCKLSANDAFLYKTLDGDDVDPGSSIKHRTRLNIYCRYVDLGDYTYDSETDNGVPQVECSNGTIGEISLKCKQGDPETCTTLANGSVRRRFLNEYKVSCNEGYALNLMRPDLPYCECRDDKLVCLYGGQTPKCEPEPCTIPYSYDVRLSIFIRRGGNVVSLSGGVTVNTGDTLYFNCINTDSDNFEPNNRRFKCKNGKWLEDEKDKDWKLGYNGELPVCRNTSCEPMCKNGGKCIRDYRCQCPHLTSGTRCEDVLCDVECIQNGGACIAPGKCGNCPKGTYGNNCEHDYQADECFKHIPKFYPLVSIVRRNDTFFIGMGISMTETKCKKECLNWKDKTCNSVWHYHKLDDNGRLTYYTCWGFEKDKRDPIFFQIAEIKYARYFVWTCAPKKILGIIALQRCRHFLIPTRPACGVNDLKYTHERCLTNLVYETGIGEKLDYWREQRIWRGTVNRVAFYAYMTDGSHHYGADQDIIFDHAVTNIGNAYSEHRGVFIAPVRGTYVFSCTLLIDGYTSWGHFVVNGQIVAKIRANADYPSSQTIVVSLNAGDDVAQTISHVCELYFIEF